ncbi:MAG: NAD(P)-binding domain-containing protein [Anaerolineae bacterium]|nr:NAD(P)-binding domain-containing protein [Anaerolineae bacterium]
MKIGVLGTGNIGGAIGQKWARAGHEVKFGARNLADPKVTALLESSGATASAGSVGEAIRHGEIILMATPGGTVQAIVEEHKAALNGKLIIDATNRMGEADVNSISSITQAAPQSPVVRAFNSLGWENFAKPVVGGTQADLFYCGPAEARATVESLITAVGLQPVYVGGLEQVRLVDSLGLLWGALAYGQKRGRRLAFKLLTE